MVYMGGVFSGWLTFLSGQWVFLMGGKVVYMGGYESHLWDLFL